MASSRRQKRKAAGVVTPKFARRSAARMARSVFVAAKSMPRKVSLRPSEAARLMLKSEGREDG